MHNARHYIGTGAKNCFYTLRYAFEETGRRHVGEGNFEDFTIHRDYHIRNLAIDREEAIAKAREITGKGMSATFEVSPIDRRDSIDWSVLQGGKFEGKSIHEVREMEGGNDYLCYLVENCKGSKRYAKTVELLEALLASELTARANNREAKLQAEATEKAARAAKSEDVAVVMAACSRGSGDFCDSIAKDLRNGFIPSGRGLSITLDIFAKAHGRRNSKAYDEAFTKAAQILTVE